jgi:hypothetical protein
MSLDIIPKSPFPDVPNLPGVPLLARAALTAIVDVTTVINIARVFATQAPADILFHATKAAPQWGVFDSTGTKAIAADNVMAFDYRGEYSISSFPVQSGEFSDYNKVKHPQNTSVLLTKGGSQSDRTTFLNQCQAVLDSLNLYNILTPERQYLNVNCTRMEMSRKDVKGAFFVMVELYFEEIQQVNAQYSSDGTQGTSTANAKSPTAIPTVNAGSVQALTPTPQTTAATISKLTTGQ